MKFKPAIPKNYPDLVLAIGAASIIVVGLFLLGIPAFNYLQGRAYEAAIRGNAATLQLAAETYASANLGQYPEDPYDLIKYLPQNEPPLNPFTGEASLFRGQPGDLTYRSPTNGQDYVIEAWGKNKGDQPRRLLLLKGHQSRW